MLFFIVLSSFLSGFIITSNIILSTLSSSFRIIFFINIHQQFPSGRCITMSASIMVDLPVAINHVIIFIRIQNHAAFKIGLLEDIFFLSLLTSEQKLTRANERGNDLKDSQFYVEITLFIFFFLSEEHFACVYLKTNFITNTLGYDIRTSLTTSVCKVLQGFCLSIGEIQIEFCCLSFFFQVPWLLRYFSAHTAVCFSLFFLSNLYFSK